MEGQAVDVSKLLTYDLAKGISTPIDKLVTQNCCNKFDTCKTGDFVLAYKERSSDSVFYVSTDGGRNFRRLELPIPHSQILHAVLPFPTIGKLLTLHGNSSEVSIDEFSIKNGQKLENAYSLRLQITGKLQARKLGQEISYLIWDDCRVWYSRNGGNSLTEARFYIHSEIGSKEKHRISTTHCAFGEDSALAYGDTAGKIGLLDSNNNFFYGIDKKSSKIFRLIATKMDMSLLTPGTEKSIVPHFDFNNRPKLMYPPKFLKVDHPAVNRPDYEKRLAVKLFPKSLFPSDYMQPFYSENIPMEYRHEFGIKACQSSGISADKSISQKPKVYYVSPQGAVNFELEFRSTLNSPTQLKYEPSFYSEFGFLNVKMEVFDTFRLGLTKWHYFKYGILISIGPNASIGSQYRLNFYTIKSLRCIHQPQLTVWIKIVEHKNILGKIGDELNATYADTLRMSQQYVMSGIIKSEGDENPLKLSTSSNHLSLKTV